MGVARGWNPLLTGTLDPSGTLFTYKGSPSTPIFLFPPKKKKKLTKNRPGTQAYKHTLGDARGLCPLLRGPCRARGGCKGA